MRWLILFLQGRIIQCPDKVLILCNKAALEYLIRPSYKWMQQCVHTNTLLHAVVRWCLALDPEHWYFLFMSTVNTSKVFLRLSPIWYYVSIITKKQLGKCMSSLIRFLTLEDITQISLCRRCSQEGIPNTFLKPMLSFSLSKTFWEHGQTETGVKKKGTTHKALILNIMICHLLCIVHNISHDAVYIVLWYHETWWYI